jgi:two-component system response regulator YesN
LLKVLIVDDEEKVCQLIHGLVPWESLRLQVVGMAHDGLSALEMLKTFKPDIMITDIRMPGVDGISLIREAKAFLPDLRCVIISGYRHFDYAHNAIKYGVEDYLLKPLQRQELIDTLSKLRSQRALPETGDDPKIQAFLSDCLRRRSGETATKERLRAQYHIEVPEDGRFYALMIKPDLSGVSAGDTIRRIASERIMDICRSALSPLLLDVKMALLPEGIAALLCVRPEREKDLHDALHSIRDRTELMRDVFPTLRVSIGVSGSERLADVPELFAQSYSALETRLLHGEGALFIGKPEPHVELFLRVVLRADTLRSLSVSLSSLQAEAYKEALRSSFEQIRGAVSDNLPLLRTMLKEMIRLHFEQLPHGTTLKEMEEMIAKFSDIWNAATALSEVETEFISLLAQHLLHVNSAHRQVEQMPLRRAKAYIREHYQKPLTLEEVSGIAGFNPAYFSTLFKKETGEKFTDYLASVRISAAQRLLMDSDLSIPLIAEKTGYGDVKYFGKQFKKAMGLSPQEYRKLYG